MAIRDDFSIDWEVSPRIITVAAPAIECSMQDILDTLRNEEAKTSNMDDLSIVSASGKEPLGAGTYVGLTVALQNATIGFEARSGPEWTICDLNGGNLVAFNTDGDAISSIDPTAFVSISKTASSSATQTEQTAIQYSSFQNAVWVDTLNGVSTLDYPSGTREYPVISISGARTIAEDKGFDEFGIIGNIVLSGIDDDVSGFKVTGQNAARTLITIEDAAITDNCEISEAMITGILDNNIIVRNSMVYDISYFSGVLFNTMINPGTVVLGNGANGYFLNCYSGGLVPDQRAVIDMGGSGQSLAMRAYSGTVEIRNKTGTDKVSVDLISGNVRVDLTTVTNGVIVVRGVGKVTDAATGDFLKSGMYGNLEIVAEVVNMPEIVESNWDTIYVDDTAASSGTGATVGQIRNPVNNMADAKIIAEREDIKDFDIHGNLTITGDYSHYYFTGKNNDDDILTMVNAIVEDVSFHHVQISGPATGHCHVHYGRIANTVGMTVNAHNSMLTGDNEFDGGYNTFINSSAVGWGSIPSINLVNGSNISFQGQTGKFTIKGMDEAAQKVSAFFTAGSMILDSTCIAGSVNLSGVVDLVDNSTNVTILRDSQIAASPAVYGGAITIDIASTYDGVLSPVGSDAMPVNNITDAKAIADLHNITKFKIHGPITLNDNFPNWAFEGASSALNDVITFNGYNINNSIFKQTTTTGVMTGTNIQMIEAIMDSVSGFSGVLFNSAINGTITLGAEGSSLLGKNVTSMGTPTTIDVVGTNRAVKLNGHGPMTFSNVIGTTDVQLGLDYGEIIFDSSCTGGTARIRGTAEPVTNLGAVVIDEKVLNKPYIANFVWDKNLSQHQEVGSAGNILSKPMYTCETGTLSVNQFTTDSTDPDGFWTGKLFIQFTGNITASLKNKTTLISSYENTGGKFVVVDLLPIAPSNGDTFYIINE